MSFWSKFLKSTAEPKEPEVEKISAAETKKITDKITKLTEQLNDETTAGTAVVKKQKAVMLTELGQCYQELSQVDKAIAAYEKSLKCSEDFGPAFDGLLKLYDVKRQAAAYAKDNSEIQKWLNKSDELTALSKKIMRSK
ncbi:tetratricopeptide repeat protein [Lactobacillus xylocopicola]|uniref:Tetratricopeptide repeat protein n=1 Tax=Lactobacillus xylocopicola TaxID=2976676 RepID=A0ABN6SP96_9LACO|nr:tetratricopeptide repeat protein [Lactobacillus xylocopicola]BDR61176.1 hypothetical protein KIM322_14370 [Lactobacillus xylocopicola]